MMNPCDEIRACKSCGEEKLVILEFFRKHQSHLCKSCLATKARLKKGKDPKDRWNTFYLSMGKRNDPRDTILKACFDR